MAPQNNMAAIMECQNIPQNMVITWRIYAMEISAIPNRTNKCKHKKN